jgi:N-acetylated-alpha-linked acidic dipeptidase
VKGYVKELKETRDGLATTIAERNRQIEDGVFRATLDPREPEELPKVEPVPPHLSFAAIDNAAEALAASAARYEKAFGKALGTAGAAASHAKVNAILLRAERAFTKKEGLPKRPWYRHLLYAPGLYTGYGVKTLPAAREAIEQKEWASAETELGRIAEALRREAALIDEATAELGKGS